MFIFRHQGSCLNDFQLKTIDFLPVLAPLNFARASLEGAKTNPCILKGNPLILQKICFQSFPSASLRLLQSFARASPEHFCFGPGNYQKSINQTPNQCFTSKVQFRFDFMWPQNQTPDQCFTSKVWFEKVFSRVNVFVTQNEIFPLKKVLKKSKKLATIVE